MLSFIYLPHGCAWRLMPHDLPPWSTVYHYFRAWRIEGIWQKDESGSERTSSYSSSERKDSLTQRLWIANQSKPRK